MSRDRKLLQQALEALGTYYGTMPGNTVVIKKAIEAIHLRLAEPEEADHRHEYFRTGAMEPGESRCIHCGEWRNRKIAEPEEADVDQLARIAKLVDEVDPYPEAKPVAWMMVNSEHDLDRSLHFEPQNWHITWEAVPLYLHPPRPAVRLSKDELEAVLSDWMLNGGKSSREIYENVQTAVLRKNGLEVKDAN